MSGYDRLRHRVEDLSRNFQAEVSQLEEETRREMEAFRQKVVEEYNARLAKYRQEAKQLRRENADLRDKMARMTDLSDNASHKADGEPRHSSIAEAQLKLPYKGGGNKRKRTDSSTSLEMTKEDFSGLEMAAKDPNPGLFRATKSRSLGDQKTRSDGLSSPGKYDFPSQLQRISPKKILVYKGKPVSDYTNSQFNKLPTQYSSDCSDSIERPQYINLEEFNRPDLEWELSPTKLAISHTKATVNGSPVRGNGQKAGRFALGGSKSTEKDGLRRTGKDGLKSTGKDGSKDTGKGSSKSTETYLTEEPALDVVEDSQEEYVPLLANGGLSSSPILADITSKNDSEQNSQHEEHPSDNGNDIEKARLSTSEVVFTKTQLEVSKIPKLGPKNTKMGPTNASRLYSSPVFGSDGSPIKATEETSPFKHVPKLYTALQRRDFLRKYYQLKFRDLKYRVDLETNPITEQKWRLGDFKPNPLYYKLKPSDGKAGVMTKQQEINNRNFFREAGHGLKSKGAEWEAGVEDEEEDWAYSQVFDKFPSPPGFMVSDFPDTQEDIRRKEVVKKRQEDRVQRRLKSSMAAWKTGGRVQGEFIFFEDVLNDFVKDGRFTRED